MSSTPDGQAAEGATAVADGPGPLLEILDVSVRFGGVYAVRDVSMRVAEREIRGLIGPNGAGKTTLFDCVTGANEPLCGTIRLDGRDISREGPVWRSRHGLRRTFQRQQPFGWLTVEDNVLAALDWRGGGGGVVGDLLALPTRRHRETARRDVVDETLRRCGLLEVRGEPAGRLPIGKARMVEFARAIVDPPRVLLLDEPTSGLDAAESDRLAHLIHDVRTEHPCAVLLVEHDVRFVMALSDRMTVLNLGEVLAEGTPAEVAQDDLVRAAYLG